MNISLKLKYIVGAVAVLLLILLSVTLYWLYNNTSLFTDNISPDDLKLNNLNSANDFELTSIDIGNKSLNIPKGFKLTEYAKDIPSARFFSFNENNVMFVGTKDNDKIYAVTDNDNDGKAETVNIIDSDLNSPHSVYYYKNDLYLGEENRVSVYRNIKNNGSYTKKELLVDDLPAGNRLTGGGHKTRTVIVGPDEKLYVSIGSSCNVCQEDDERRATIMRYDLDGSKGEIFANGLRNTVGLDFDKQNQLWGADMGRDQIGDDIPPEEINLIQEGKDYGWPYCYGNQINNPEYKDKQQYCQTLTEASVFDMQAHSAPLGFTFLNDVAKDSWPNIYQDGYFVAFHGSWNRTIPTGYKVVFIDTSENEPKQYNLLSGWLESSADAWGRPVGLGFDNNGNLYISDDKQGLVYKLEYKPEDQNIIY